MDNEYNTQDFGQVITSEMKESGAYISIDPKLSEKLDLFADALANNFNASDQMIQRNFNRILFVLEDLNDKVDTLINATCVK